MQQFINEIINFIYSIWINVRSGISTQPGASNLFDTFASKNVFMENSLIGLNITWTELILILSVFILVILFIVLIVKFILKILGLFRFNRLND